MAGRIDLSGVALPIPELVRVLNHLFVIDYQVKSSAIFPVI